MKKPTVIEMLGPWGAAVFYALAAEVVCVALGELCLIGSYALELWGHQ